MYIFRAHVLLKEKNEASELSPHKVGPGSSYKWSCNPYEWPYKWVSYNPTCLLVGIISPFITVKGQPCRILLILLMEQRYC